MILQLAIAVLGGLAIYLTQQRHEGLKRYACLFGLASQPMFLWSTYQNAQWGMFALAVFYTWSWCLGIYNNWIVRSDRSGDAPGETERESASRK